MANENRSAPPSSAIRVNRTRVRWSSLLLAIFAIVVLVVTLTPDPLDKGLDSDIRRVLSLLHGRGLPEWFGYRELEFSANIALFVPLAFLIAMALPLRLSWLTLVIGPALSIVIELVQATMLSARFATVSDVVANSLGAWIGTVLAIVLRFIVRRRDQALLDAQRRNEW